MNNATQRKRIYDAQTTQIQNSKSKLNIDTVPRAHGPPPFHGVVVLSRLVYPENGTGNAYQLEQMPQAEGLCLEDALQERQVYNAGLAREGAEDGVVEHLVTEEGQLAAEHGLALAAAGQRVEHVEEDEAGEGHGGVVGGDHARAFARVLIVVNVTHLVDIYGKRAKHDERGGGEDALDKRLCEHPSCLGARWTAHDGRVDRFDAERLCGRAIHQNICHNVSDQNSSIDAKNNSRSHLLIHNICIALSGFLNPRAVLNRIRLSAATLVLSWNVMKFWML